MDILIIEDGDEYLSELTAFVSEHNYTQAKSAAAAECLLNERRFDLVYLDMRFDRIPVANLVGDLEQATSENRGDKAKALRFLQNNQGLYILAHLANTSLGAIPVIIAYDFSFEERRFERLRQRFKRILWVPDRADGRLIGDLIRRASKSGDEDPTNE